MHRVDGPGHDNNQFTEGDPGQGIEPTTVTADIANALQEEIAQTIEATGLGLEKADNTQLWKAIRKAVELPEPLLDLPLQNDLVPRRGAGVLSYGRGGTGTIVDRYGKVITAAIDEPRFSEKGLLIEGQAENLLVKSEKLENAIWIKTNVSVTADATTAPDGTLTADKIVENTADSYHYGYKSISVTSGKQYKLSAFIKKGSGTRNAVLEYYSSGGLFPQAGLIVDPADGSVVFADPDLDDYDVMPAADGFWHVFAIATATGTGSANVSPFGMVNGTSQSYLGDGSSSIYFWGVDCKEHGIMDSYIPTDAATATRLADSLSIPAHGNIPLAEDDWAMVATYYLLGAKASGAQDVIRIVGETTRGIRASYNGSRQLIGFAGDTFIYGTIIPARTHVRAGLRCLDGV
ncbi:MAG: hypothetical protein OEZ59_13545, partial [Deltaproteobacteria bacterium]|nr:hypothetical protein [Deltaproteobacteria bacterium]